MPEHRVAVATTDGKVVNEHFGRAKFFTVFDIGENGIVFAERRDTIAVCREFSHNESDFDKVIKLLGDCEAVFVAKIGYGAAAYIIQKGLRVFEAPGFIEDVLQKVIDDKLLETV
ncbi:MAG: NifB/NifX family molybdenum-iron cluster-binding protein [Oscillospiraceae bacterium]